MNIRWREWRIEGKGGVLVLIYMHSSDTQRQPESFLAKDSAELSSYAEVAESSGIWLHDSLCVACIFHLHYLAWIKMKTRDTLN